MDGGRRGRTGPLKGIGQRGEEVAADLYRPSTSDPPPSASACWIPAPPEIPYLGRLGSGRGRRQPRRSTCGRSNVAVGGLDRAGAVPEPASLPGRVGLSSLSSPGAGPSTGVGMLLRRSDPGRNGVCSMESKEHEVGDALLHASHRHAIGELVGRLRRWREHCGMPRSRNRARSKSLREMCARRIPRASSTSTQYHRRPALH